MSDEDKTWQNWRQVLKVHPVADEFPKATEKALKELRGSIGSDGSGLEMEIVLASIAGSEPMLIDGRTRLDALEANGVRVFDTFGHLAVKHKIEQIADEADAWVLGRKLNHDRRHLKHEDKVAIAKSILAKCPTRSSRAIAKEAGCDHKTVEAVRNKESGGEIPHLVDTPKVEVSEPKPIAAGGEIPHLEAQPPAGVQSGHLEAPAAPIAAPVAQKRTGADGKAYTVKPKLKTAPKPHVTELPTKPTPSIVETLTATPAALPTELASLAKPRAVHPDPAIGNNGITQEWREGEESERISFAKLFGRDVARYHPEPFKIALDATDHLSAAECDELALYAMARAEKLKAFEKAEAV